jgi:methylated-DNA-[protein]-cysteine S-methyltransferase
MNYVHKIMPSPVGQLTLVASRRGLVGVLWEGERLSEFGFESSSESQDDPRLREAEGQLFEYFAGQRRSFVLDLDVNGTQFQKKVWKELTAIPFGETRTYGDLAKKIGKPFASRAVGSANRRNPIPIIIPCHRVIGSKGKLTGFAGGLEIKARLLEMEDHNG